MRKIKIVDAGAIGVAFGEPGLQARFDHFAQRTEPMVRDPILDHPFKVARTSRKTPEIPGFDFRDKFIDIRGTQSHSKAFDPIWIERLHDNDKRLFYSPFGFSLLVLAPQDFDEQFVRRRRLGHFSFR